MMLEKLNPAAAPQPASNYCQAVAVEGAARWLHISGQIGLDAEGRFVGDAEAQMRQCWRNILGILEGAGMGRDNLVKVTVLLTDAELVPMYRQIRDEMLDGYICASTMMVISALAHPDWVVEIEAVAAA
jgi:2-iminobutanoate/2-iminopropanoate deaminase